MTRKLKTLVLVAIFAIIGMYQSNAQTDFSIHLGMLFPQGDFAESRMDNEQVAWLNETDRAGAGLGFDAGLKFRFNLPSVKGLGFITTADFFLNMPNDDVKDWKEDIISEKEEYYFVDEFSIAIPHYINIPIMVGLNYEYEIKDNIKFWGEGSLGLNIGALTNCKLSVIRDDYEATNTLSYYINTSLAFQFGAGFMFNDKYSLGVHYYSLGSQKIIAEVMWERIDGSYSYIDEERFTFGRINPRMLTIRLGYHF